MTRVGLEEAIGCIPMGEYDRPVDMITDRELSYS